MNSLLQRFQEYGDTKSLLEFVRLSGRSVQKYARAVGALAPVFEALTHGERPSYESLDTGALGHLMAEVEDIVEWMAAGSKADIRTRAIELMGALGCERFVPRLEGFLFSQVQWERLTAIAALAQIPGERSAELLRIAADDHDPQIRAEVRRVTKARENT
jgi:HEAT repeat protein